MHVASLRPYLDTLRSWQDATRFTGIRGQSGEHAHKRDSLGRTTPQVDKIEQFPSIYCGGAIR